MCLVFLWPGREWGYRRWMSSWTLDHFRFPSSLWASNLVSTSLFPSTKQRAFCTNYELHRWMLSPSCLRPVGNGFHICLKPGPCIMEWRLNSCQKLPHYQLHRKRTWGAFFLKMLTTRAQTSKSATPDRAWESVLLKSPPRWFQWQPGMTATALAWRPLSHLVSMRASFLLWCSLQAWHYRQNKITSMEIPQVWNCGEKKSGHGAGDHE